MDKEGSLLRKELMKQCRFAVIKAGTRLLTDRAHIAELVSGIAAFRAANFRVLLVTSGAVGLGMRKLGLAKRPRELAQVQALAAIGQCGLMAAYSEECAKHGFECAQLLLTAADLRSRERYLNVKNCIGALWERGVLPIVNENDSVSVDELKFGDNDILSGMLSTLTGAGLTVILTTEQGLRERDAATGRLGARLSVVEKVTDKISSMAGGTDNSEFSIGGMASKLRAAAMVNAAGGHLWIADGREAGIAEKLLAGEDVGTLFLPAANRLHGRKKFIRFFARCSGVLTLDAGAVRAVTRENRSLLPSGMIAVAGKFKRGDSVELADESGCAVARGLVNFDSEECAKLLRCQSRNIAEKLGRDADADVVHKDNLALL